MTIIPGLRASVHRKLNGGKQPFVRGEVYPGAPGAPATPETKIPENWYSSREFGSFSCPAGPGA